MAQSQGSGLALVGLYLKGATESKIHEQVEWKEEIKSSGSRGETSLSWVKRLVFMKVATNSPAVVDGKIRQRQAGIRGLAAGKGTENANIMGRWSESIKYLYNTYWSSWEIIWSST